MSVCDDGELVGHCTGDAVGILRCIDLPQPVPDVLMVHHIHHRLLLHVLLENGIDLSLVIRIYNEYLAELGQGVPGEVQSVLDILG